MQRRRPRPKRTLRYLAAAAAGLLAADTAHGFYFAGWPGDGRPRERHLVPPSASILENPPSARDDIEWYQELPKWERPHGPDDDHPPADTPEPATLITAVVGAAVVGLAARRNKKK